MANAVCQNGQKGIPVDSRFRSFSLTAWKLTAGCTGAFRLKQANGRRNKISYAFQIN
jgi:hypothetical protein